MRPVVLFEDEGFENLLPLVFWRTVFELRVGRSIILDRTAQRLQAPIAGVWTRDWIARVAALRCGAPANQPLDRNAVLVNGRWIVDGTFAFPDESCVGLIGDEVAFITCVSSLAAKLTPADLLDPARRATALKGLPRRTINGRMFRYIWQVVDDLEGMLTGDWQSAQAAVESKLDKSLRIGPLDSIHVGERVSIHPTAVIDASQGPILISDDVKIGPYAVIEGPAHLGPGSSVHPHTWLHGGVATGPVCKLSGEVTGTIIAGYSNKSHHGFLGDSYVGNWCNLGAGATNSNLKNTYGNVRVPINGREVETGLQFFGAIIADHAKIGISASLPTGAVIGFAANVAPSGFCPKFVPSFAWITPEGASPGNPAKALDIAKTVMARRNVNMTSEDAELFLRLGELASRYEARGSS